MTTKQGSDDWITQRLGKVTASVIHKIYSDKKTVTKNNLAHSLAMERLSGRRMANVKTVDMVRGLTVEPHARNAYEKATHHKVSLVGFIQHPTMNYAGASPDGFVGDDGIIEIKCLNIRNHDQILKTQRVPKQYLYQMQFQLACTQRKWADFVAYHPEADENLYIHRVSPDKTIIAELHNKVACFLEEVELLYRKLKQSNAEELYKYL